MSKSLRLSDELFCEAEKSAQIFHRSLPQQIEHWAQIGRIMEAALSYPAQTKVKAVSMQDIDMAIALANTPQGTLKAQAVIRETSGEIVQQRLGDAASPYYAGRPTQTVLENRLIIEHIFPI